jgi:UDP-N-acetylglucosamine acyltransferase
MMIHPTAIVDPRAELESGVSVGAYTLIGPHVRIGTDTAVDAHAVIKGPTEIGARCRISPFASIGDNPQDIKYQGEPTRLVIGNDTVIREYVTINRGTVKGGGITRVGNGNFLMAYVHIAHDCQVHDHVIMANAATLAGHIEIEDFAVLGGLVAVHQFVKIGRNAFIGGCSAIPQDVPPYCLAAGNRARLYGLNLTGLKRHNFSAQTLKDLKTAYRLLFRSGLTIKHAIEQIRQTISNSPEVDHFVEFIETSERGVIR